ncbi:hypothetical protein [Thalassolituus sp. UBA2009]|uniref:hypothetical protein n=1 Tax=Thalassolituus sp. UBA2009 TaxID=1947658 RepID=UPI00257F1852|nr:hypothetical protein [Thalassolituus sp. UBA2009]
MDKPIRARRYTAQQAAVITVKNTQVNVVVDGDVFGITINNSSACAISNSYTADLSLTRLDGGTYLDTGAMLLGPIDDDSARKISGLLMPVIH